MILKTVKDLKESIGISIKGEVCKKEVIANPLYHYVNIGELRQEAIKDIKKLRKKSYYEPLMIGSSISQFFNNKGIAEEVISYIMWKFDIKEKNLK